MIQDAELNQRIRYRIKLLEKTKEEYELRLDKLHDCKDSLLRSTKIRGRNYYYIKRRGSKKYKYVKTSRKKEVQLVREARFLKEAIRRVDKNIALLKAAVDGCKPFDPSAINESLPKIYRSIVPPVSELYERESAKWKASMLEHQKRFPENYPEHKTQTTSDHVKVKSISELLLYEMFKSAGLTQIYELPFPQADYGPPLYPDFTILSPIDMKTEIIVEFVGRMDMQSYRESLANRVGRYMASGYIPGVNLFFIYGDYDGNIDTTQIEKVIADIKGL